jgi:hypothetical protein
MNNYKSIVKINSEITLIKAKNIAITILILIEKSKFKNHLIHIYYRLYYIIYT